MIDYPTTAENAEYFARARRLRAEAAHGFLARIAALFSHEKGPRVAARPQAC